MNEKRESRQSARSDTIVDSVLDLDAAEMEPLVPPGDIYASRPWLLHLEYITGPITVVTARGDGVLQGCVPAWRGLDTSTGLFDPVDMFQGLPGPWTEDFLWLGTPRSTHNTLACVTDARRPSVLARLIRSARDHAKGHGLHGVIAPYMPVTQAEELAAAHPGASVLLHAVEGNIDVPPGGMADVLAAADPKNRSHLQQEMRRFAGAGYSLDWEKLTGPLTDEIAPLIARNRRKYGSTQGPEWLHRVFEAQWRAGLTNDTAVCLGRRDGKVVATSVHYRHGPSLHFRYSGASDAEARRHYAYYATSFYGPIDYAAQHGIRHLGVSISSLEAKIRRGAVLDPLAAVVLPVSESFPTHTHTQQNEHNHRFAAATHNRFAEHPHAFGAVWSKWPQSEPPL